MIDQEYGKWFSNLIVQHGLTKVIVGDELASRLGISSQAGRDIVYKYAKGTRRPGSKNIVHLAKILNISEEELMRGKENEDSLYLTHLSNLFLLKGDVLKYKFNKMNQVFDVSKNINPLLNKDEYGRNALDYCWLYRNGEGIALLIKNGIVNYNDFFSSIYHPSNPSEKIYLTNMIKLILENDNEELFDICYPKVNKYKVVESFNKIRFKLYTSFIKEDALNYMANNLPKHKELYKHQFSFFELNEKDFLARNTSLIGRVNLMKLPSTSILSNLLINKMIKLDKMDEEVIEESIKFNDSVLKQIFSSGIDIKKFKIEENGQLILKEDKQKYWLTTIVKFDFEKALGYAEVNDLEDLKQNILLLQRQNNLKSYKEEFLTNRKKA